MPKEFIGLNVEKHEKAQLRQLAKENFRTLADYLRLVIRNHLNGGANSAPQGKRE